MEINHLISETTALEPIDFAVDIDGTEGHSLIVLDVTPYPWAAIQRGEFELPPGWSLDGMQELLRAVGE